MWGVLHAAVIRWWSDFEKLRVEEGQLLPGEGTGGPQQVIRPAADLVGADAEPPPGWGSTVTLAQTSFPGTGGIHELHAALLRLIVKGHGIAAPLPGIETDITEGVGVSVEVVIGVVVCKIGKAAHIQRVGLRQVRSVHRVRTWSACSAVILMRSTSGS